MNFGEEFRRIRTQKGLTQEQVAARLNLSRQAVSNWENNRNLPDIEMLVTIARRFDLSLDSLLLGDADNALARKLIRDGSEGRRARVTLHTVRAGGLLLLLGAMCLLIKANSPEFVDAAGVLHESFFLLPVGFAFLFGGLLALLAAGLGTIGAFVQKRRGQKAERADDIK